MQRDRDARVAVSNEADRDDVLQYQTGDGEKLASRVRRPLLATHVHQLSVVQKWRHL